LLFNKINICIIGSGKLGLSFVDFFNKNNCNFKLICRSESSFKNALKFVNQSHILRNISEIDTIPNMFILAVKDDEIKTTSNILAEKFKYLLDQKYCIHCSGMLSSNELIACKEYGAIALSLHPYQTFFYSKAENFKDIHWGIEGDINSQVIDFIKFMGGVPHKIDTTKKIIYHISAVAMSNYLNTAIALGKLTSQKAGISPEEFAPEIIKTTVSNILNPNDIARGDVNTVVSHITALKQEDNLLKPYCYLGLGTLELSKSANLINEEIYNNLKIIFEENLK